MGRKSSRILSHKVIFSVPYKGKPPNILICTLHITQLAWLEEHHSGEPELVDLSPSRVCYNLVIWDWLWFKILSQMSQFKRSCQGAPVGVKPWDLSPQKSFSIQIWRQRTHTDNVWKEYRTCTCRLQLQLYLVCLSVREGLLQVRSNCDYQAKIGKRWWAICMRHNSVIYTRKNKTRLHKTHPK